MSHSSYSFKTLKPIMNSYPYFTLQQKLENIDESLKEIVLNYIQFIINVHSAQNNDIIKSNTSYALRLRESEIKNKQLQSENIGLRVTVAQLRAKVEKLRCQRAKTNDNFKESVKSANDKIIALVQQLQSAADSLNTIVDPESARGSSFISDGSSILSSSIDLPNGGLYATNGIQYPDTDTTEMNMHKKKSINSLTAYRNEPKDLIPINEQEDPESLISASNSHKLEQDGDEYLSEKAERVQAKIPQEEQQRDESPSKKKLRRAKNGNDLLPLREKDSNLEVIFAKKETNFKQQEAEQHTEGKYLSVDVETDQLCQKSKIQDYTHESKESVESTTFLHVNRTSPSQHQLQSVAEKGKPGVLTPSQTIMSNTSSINRNERPFQEESYEINNLKLVEQNMEISEKHNKRQTRGMINEGESLGRKRSRINYAEPNLRSKLRKGDPHTYTLKTNSQNKGLRSP
ncbi:unnamed protein product [Rhizophagus irregularis]|uniref:Shugoshin C-terminal domain-containing protein n=1 Tax=Rhizophagus irregularis TaxID=588596 RepID=A0A915YMB7_9GLOM|nr:unnamed protein product [Rhizophagus irregularis]CAB5291066.1 unnamed protein product [Rhizophagus irregularis]CAB5379325.1 unnamed protein product [Rhizophagus irregularis]